VWIITAWQNISLEGCRFSSNGCTSVMEWIVQFQQSQVYSQLKRKWIQMPRLCMSISLQIIVSSSFTSQPNIDTLSHLATRAWHLFLSSHSSTSVNSHVLPVLWYLLDLFITILMFIFVLCDIFLFPISELSLDSCYFLYHLILFSLNFVGRCSILLLLCVLFISVPVSFVLLYILNI